jgi:hypothetical protein
MMSEQKFTPGPWHVCFTRIGKEVIYWHVADSKSRTLNAIACADEGRGKQFPSSQLQANAHLISAAPDLLEALQSLEKRFYACIELGLSAGEAFDSFYQEIVREAISKALGEQS